MGLIMVAWAGGVSCGALLVGMWGHSVIAGLMLLVLGQLCEAAGVR
jgi:hypothetical protein